MRIVFMGTPEFAVPSLQALVENGYEVVGVFCQPDRPAGRGNKIVMCPVKQYALSQGIEVVQVEKIRRPDGLEALKRLNPDICVTAAFGQILSKENLSVPPMGTVNVHASLLPRHRGAAPMNWAILMGDKVTGVTTMYTDPGLDTGDILLKSEIEILPEETADELSVRVSHLGAELLIKTLQGISDGSVKPVPQNPDESSYEPLLNKALGQMDFSKDAQSLVNHVRGLNSWPGAWAYYEDKVLKVWKAAKVSEEQLAVLPDYSSALPGTVLLSDARKGLYVRCGDGAVELVEIQAPNAKRMQTKAYLLGKSIPVGVVLH